MRNWRQYEKLEGNVLSQGDILAPNLLCVCVALLCATTF